MLFASLSKGSPKQFFRHLQQWSNFKQPLEMSGVNGVPLQDVVKVLEEFANPKLAESWDNVGLLVEPISQPLLISKIMLTNDLTEPVMEEALSERANLIISYHPPIFAPLKRITNSSWKERVIGTCMENKIAIYSPHTAWDACEYGVTDWLSKAFDGNIKNIEPIVPTEKFDQYIVDVIIPASTDENSYLEMHNYLNSEERKGRCLGSYELTGRTVYQSLLTKGEIDYVSKFPGILISKTEAVGESELKPPKKTGMGRKIIFKQDISLKECVHLIKNHTGLKHVRLALAINKTQENFVKSVALVPGSGGSLLKGINADLYITGEMFHHDLLEANHNSTSIILTNHSDSERGFLAVFKESLVKLFPTLSVILSSSDRDPIETF